MLPFNEISVAPQVSAYLSPDVMDVQDSQSFELGGIALNDPSQGREVQIWRAWIDGADIKVAPYPGLTPTTILVSGADITTVSLAFDTNMAPTLCYMQAGALNLRWFNSLTESFQTDSYAPATSGKVSTDDKRSTQEGASDVIFAYTRDGMLYWRQERDRYGVERAIGASGTRRLGRVGMATNLRMQFELVEA